MHIIDFHGLQHADVENELVRKINYLWDTGTELMIITGNSDQMKDIVMKVLYEHKLQYTIGDALNKGYIKTVI